MSTDKPVVFGSQYVEGTEHERELERFSAEVEELKRLIAANARDESGRVSMPLAGLRKIDEARARADAAGRELERWRHGVPVEGDFICPDTQELQELRQFTDDNALIQDAAFEAMRERAEAAERQVEALIEEDEGWRDRAEAAERERDELKRLVSTDKPAVFGSQYVERLEHEREVGRLNKENDRLLDDAETIDGIVAKQKALIDDLYRRACQPCGVLAVQLVREQARADAAERQVEALRKIAKGSVTGTPWIGREARRIAREALAATGVKP